MKRLELNLEDSEAKVVSLCFARWPVPQFGDEIVADEGSVIVDDEYCGSVVLCLDEKVVHEVLECEHAEFMYLAGVAAGIAKAKNAKFIVIPVNASYFFRRYGSRAGIAPRVEL